LHLTQVFLGFLDLAGPFRIRRDGVGRGIVVEKRGELADPILVMLCVRQTGG